MNSIPPFTDTPITGSPLDYVPSETLTTGYKPSVFKAPFIYRAVVAGVAAALLVSGLAFPAFGAGMIAIMAIVAVIWAADKLVPDHGGPTVTTAASMWPDPFSWVPVLMVLCIILASIYFI